MAKHIALLAYGPSLHQYVSLANGLGGREALADQVWAVNGVGSTMGCDAVFHMDDVRIQEIRAAADPEGNIAAMLAWLKRAKKPVFTSRAHPDYPALIEYPLEAVLNATGGVPYFNSTPAYAIGLALALYGGDLILSLFGLDYTYANAHHAEKGRACIEYWLGRACALGADVRISDRSSLLDSCEPFTLYGYAPLGSYAPQLSRRADGSVKVAFEERLALPSAEEIERAYDHSRHPSPLVADAPTGETADQP